MKILIIALQFLFVFETFAQHSDTHQSKYVGQENRKIKSLSPEDINALETGKGWGLAKAAELNGVPGPKHLLEMKEEIELSKIQKDKINKLFNKMKNQAIPLGKKLVQLEAQLNDSFKANTVNSVTLDELLNEISKTRKELRFVHLNSHLSSLPVLSDQQLKLYNKLRGYSDGDPCSNIPSGHNPILWKKHNNCN